MRYLVVVLLLCGSLVTAQNKKSRPLAKPLAAVLKGLETTFNVRFSYNSALVTSKKIQLESAKDLKSVLKNIGDQLNLEFVFLDSRNILIKSKAISEELLTVLEEVVLVSEYLTSGLDRNKNNGSLRLQPSKLGILPGLTEPDVLQSLQLLPGISSPTETAANLNIRGGTPDQNLILYDGIRVYHQGHLFGMIAPFNPYVVASVNVFRSGTSAEFGERIAGVIDIESSKEIPDALEGGLGVNFLHADAYVKLPLFDKKGSLMLSARSSINNLIALPTFNAFSDKVFQNTKIEENDNLIIEEELTVLDDRFQFTDMTGTFLLKPNKRNSIEISALRINNSLNYANIDVDSEGTRDVLEVANTGVSMHWKSRYSSKTTLETQLRYSKFKSNYNLAALNNAIETHRLSKQNKVDDLGANMRLNTKLSEQSSLLLGYDLASFDVGYDLIFFEDQQENDSYKEQLTTHAVFSELSFRSQKLYVRAGARAGYFSADKRVYIEPRLFADYKLGNNFSLKASAEIKNQAIGQLVYFEFNELGLDESIWVLSDGEDIPVLNNKQFTFGFEFSKNNWLLDAEFYSKNMKGLTSLTRGFSASNQLGAYATGTSKITGLDLLLKKKMKRYRTWIAYSFSKNDFTFTDLQTTSFPGNFDQRHVLSWSNTYRWKKYQFSLGWQFASGRPISSPSGIDNDELQYDSLNNTRLGNYHRLDASAMYNFYLDKQERIKARFGISMINMYNRDNDLDTQFSIDDQAPTQWVEQFTIGLGFTANAVFRIYF